MNKNPMKKIRWRPYLLFAVLLIMANCGHDPYYYRVVSIEGVPETGEVETPLVLTGTVRPAFASYKDIVWSVKDAGTTEASLSGNILNAAAVGTVTITAVITEGKAEGKDYTQDFLVNIVYNGPPVIPAYYDVIFESNGGNTPASQRVEGGACATRPDDPEKTGFSFDDWYSDSDLTKVYDFNTPVTGNITLYAKWVKLIYNIAIEVTGPGKGETPDTTAAISASAESGDSYTLSAVSWSPAHNPFLGGTRYMAAVTVTAKTDSKFAESLTAEINGYTAAISGRTDTSVTISYTFAQTLAKAIKAISLETQPSTLAYTHGDTLDLSGLSVKLTLEDDTTEIVDLADFESKTISSDPADGDTLSHTAHDNKPVTVSIGGHHVNTADLTVNKATPAISFPTAEAITYGDKLSQSELKGGSTLYGYFAWQDGATVPPVNNIGYLVDFTPYDASNYDYTSINGWNGEKVIRSVYVTVYKAHGADVGTPIVAPDASSLSVIVTPLSQPASGQTVEYAKNTTTATPESGWQDGTTFSGLSLDTTYYFFARSKANVNYNAGTAKISATSITFHNVTFKIDDGRTVLVQNVLSGGKATEPPDPTGYIYDGWYKEAYVNKWNFNSDTVTGSITLYAKRLFTYGLTLTFEEIEQAPTISIPVISRTGANRTTTVSVENPSQYDSITWFIQTYGISETGSSIELNSKDFMVGKHYITLEVRKNDVPYGRTITFEVVK
ncbi:hypothetical protein R84B8_01741 [Treponema sp. R8-4-B8]